MFDDYPTWLKGVIVVFGEVDSPPCGVLPINCRQPQVGFRHGTSLWSVRSWVMYLVHSPLLYVCVRGRKIEEAESES